MINESTESTPLEGAPRKRYVRAVGPRLRWVLFIVFGLFALLSANSVYLGAITFLEWLKADPNSTYQNWFYMVMFGTHLVLGLLIVVPVVLFGILHIRNAHDRSNRRAVRVGYTLFAVSLVLLFTGVALMRFDFFVIKDPRIRSPIYWAHIITPVLAVWLYLLHRLAGPRIKWAIGIRWAAGMGVAVVVMIFFHSVHPRKNEVGSAEGKKYFEPSEARTASGNFVPEQTMMMDNYCQKCHQDNYQGWFHSAHHFSSFNNRAYLFSVKETRTVGLQRDGNLKAARWCAGCHDPVPFFSGAFDDPKYDIEKHPTATAGITCTSCHAITHVHSTIGNAAYTIDEPIHYPFAYSTNAALQWVNQQLVKAKPEFHKKTFLKPFMKSAEFCSTCHKVSLPHDVTKYKDFLRGQNHYDTYLLSGISGHNARAFYYPPKAFPNCASCHMPLRPSDDFGARYFAGTNVLSVHDHLFPGANTGIAHFNESKETIHRHQQFLTNSVRIDIFGLKPGGTVDSPLIAPLRPATPKIVRGKPYLLETVVRTLRVGHPLTQGTADSNELWVDARISTLSGRVLGRSGGLGEHKEVDPYAHRINIYMLDKDGNRIDRRNPQDIFTPLYNHQVPPGAAAVVHYAFTVPEDVQEPLLFEVALKYRKFDTVYMNYAFGRDYSNGAPFQITNDLPITTIAVDRITLPVEGAAGLPENPPSPIQPAWQRWNDYGIGQFLSGNVGSEKGELIQAAGAFAEVEKLGIADGPLNLARVYLKEGRLDEAVEALQRAARIEPPAPRWTLAWLNGLVNKQNGYLDKAITEFRSILEDRTPEMDRRGFDFSKDYEVLNELGQTLFERAKSERGDQNRASQEDFLRQAIERFQQTLALDSENLTAHYNLALIYAQMGKDAEAHTHRQAHEKYRPDDNARDRAISIARRRDRAADQAAQSIVIYNLQRSGAPEFGGANRSTAAPSKLSSGGVGE